MPPRTRILDATGRPVRFGYDATDTSNRRKAPTSNLDSEDAVLAAQRRRSLTSTTRDLQRNFTVAAWAIRKHLDYVSTFTFQARTGDETLNDRIEALVDWWDQARNCDLTGRHRLSKLIRMAEERRTVDGDVLALKLASQPDSDEYGRIQWIEGDRIGLPSGPLSVEMERERDQWTHGVRTDDRGRPVAYAIMRRPRAGGMMEFERVLDARWCRLHAFFNRFDQVRGVSPLAAAINTYRDAYEGADYALAKMKVSQYFGLIFTRSAEDAMGIVEQTGGDAAQGTATYKADFKDGPIQMELDQGDDAKFLESHTPSAEFAAFWERMIAVALKGLDIPYSFFAENFTNFSGARQALLQYEQSADIKREDNQELLDNLTAWRLGLFVADGVLELPAGVRFRDLAWEWVPRAIPWIDPLKEGSANKIAVECGFDSTVGVCKSAGRDAYQIAREQADYNAYRENLGLAPIQSGTVTAVQVVTDEREGGRDGR